VNPLPLQSRVCFKPRRSTQLAEFVHRAHRRCHVRRVQQSDLQTVWPVIRMHFVNAFTRQMSMALKLRRNSRIVKRASSAADD
jgi:hypothetical protein